MRLSVPKLLKRFAREEKGNVILLFGLSVVPLMALMGGAVDITRHNRYQVQLANAVDAAGLALVRQEQEQGEPFSDEGAKEFVANYVNAFGIEDDMFSIDDFAVTRTGTGYTVEADASMENVFLPMLEIWKPEEEKVFDEWAINTFAEIVRSSKNIELAMVLDVTGSMAGQKIQDLKDAAEELIDIVVKPPAQQTPFYSKVAIVPYSMGVNAGNYAADVRGAIAGSKPVSGTSWLTTTVKNIDSTNTSRPTKVTTTTNHGFSNGDWVYITGVSGTSTLNGNAYEVKNKTNKTFELEQLDGNNEYSSRSGSGGKVTKCTYPKCDVTLTALNHGFQTDDRVHVTDVGGTTSINDHTYKVTKLTNDTIRLHDSGPGNSAYTSGGSAWCTVAQCEFFYFQNASSNSGRTHRISTCVSERTGAEAYTDAAPSGARVGLNYHAAQVPGIADDSIYTENPCLSNTIYPLSSSITDLKAQITAFNAEGSTAGQIGIGWGWYMVSPNFASIWPADINRPAAYGAPNTVKVVVIMTDGAFNTPYCNGVISADAGTGSGSARDHINCNATNGNGFDQAEAMCAAMKAEDVVVYTVGFDVASEQGAQDVMSNCATSPAHVYLPSTGTALKDAFKQIAQDVDSLRIAR